MAEFSRTYLGPVRQLVERLDAAEQRSAMSGELTLLADRLQSLGRRDHGRSRRSISKRSRCADHERGFASLDAVRCCVAAAYTTTQAADLQSPAWPERPIHLIVPGGTGGIIDIRARWLAERLARVLRQPVMVENKPGAGGNIGMELAAHSAPDGYTLVIVHQGTMTMNPHLYARTGYDALRDFIPITRVGVGPLVLAVTPQLPARSVPS